MDDDAWDKASEKEPVRGLESPLVADGSGVVGDGIMSRDFPICVQVSAARSALTWSKVSLNSTVF